MITWYEIECFHCLEGNMLCNGDETDLSQSDMIGAFKCWKCGKFTDIDYNGNVVDSKRPEYEHEEGLQPPNDNNEFDRLKMIEIRCLCLLRNLYFYNEYEFFQYHFVKKLMKSLNITMQDLKNFWNDN